MKAGWKKSTRRAHLISQHIATAMLPENFIEICSFLTYFANKQTAVVIYPPWWMKNPPPLKITADSITLSSFAGQSWRVCFPVAAVWRSRRSSNDASLSEWSLMDRTFTLHLDQDLLLGRIKQMECEVREPSRPCLTHRLTDFCSQSLD